jgi:hypothetical protein
MTDGQKLHFGSYALALSCRGSSHIADQMTHKAARTIMRRIALDYDRLAKLAEEQLADQERGAIGPKT